MCSLVKMVRDQVYGNGTPGLRSDVRVLSTEMGIMKEAIKDLTKQMLEVRRTIWTGIGAIAVLQIVVVPAALKLLEKLTK